MLFVMQSIFLPRGRHKRLFLTVPPGQKAAASREHKAHFTHIAFRKIYLERRTTATRGKGKRSKMDTIMAGIKAACLNTGAHRCLVLLCSPFGGMLNYKRNVVLTDYRGAV